MHRGRGQMKYPRTKTFCFFGGIAALLATVAFATGFDQIQSGWLKIGNGSTASKKLEFNVGLGSTNDPFFVGDINRNVDFSALALRFLEVPANGTNYVELKVPTSLSGNSTVTIQAVTDTLVGRLTSDTLTNKDLTATSNTFAPASASATGMITNAAQTLGGAKTLTGDLLVAPTGATTTYENTNGGGAVSLTSPVVSLGANDNSTSGSGSVLFADTVGGSFNQHFLAVNSSGSKIRTASIVAGSTNTAGSETGTLAFSTKPSGGTATASLTLGNDQVGTFAVGAKFPSSGATAATFNFYAEDDSTLSALVFKGNGTGASNSSSTSVKITRVGRTVTLDILAMTSAATGTSSTRLDSQTALPSWARPGGTKACYTAPYNNGAYIVGGLAEFDILATGIFNVYRDVTATAFTNSANAGFAGLSCTYSI